MSLINVNNSLDIEVESVSIRLYSESHGTRYLDVSSLGNHGAAEAVVAIADGRAKVSSASEAVGTLNALLSASRSLYNLQSVLNFQIWEELRLTVEVEASVTHTSTTHSPRLTLLVKTTWQDASELIDLT